MAELGGPVPPDQRHDGRCIRWQWHGRRRRQVPAATVARGSWIFGFRWRWGRGGEAATVVTEAKGPDGRGCRQPRRRRWFRRRRQQWRNGGDGGAGSDAGVGRFCGFLIAQAGSNRPGGTGGAGGSAGSPGTARQGQGDSNTPTVAAGQRGGNPDRWGSGGPAVRPARVAAMAAAV